MTSLAHNAAEVVEAAIAPSPVRLSSPITVLIVVGVCLYRDGLARALGSSPDVTVVGSVDTLAAAVEVIAREQPGVILLDPTTDPGFSLVGLVGEVSPGTRIVALGVREVEDEVLRCATAGVAGYVPREGSIADLVTVIESAAHGKLKCSPQIAASLFRRLAFLSETNVAGGPGLTPREVEIVGLLEEGLSNKQISNRLRIELSTVKNHVHNLLKKLNTPRRGAAAALARHMEARTVKWNAIRNGTADHNSRQSPSG